MSKLQAVSSSKRWEFVKKWVTDLLATIHSKNVIGVDVINEPLRLKKEKAAPDDFLSKLLGQDWEYQAIEIVKEVCGFPLFICQHQIGYQSVQEEFSLLMSNFSGLNSAVQCTSSSFAVSKFDELAKFLDTLPGIVHVPEISIWKYRMGNKPVPSPLRQHGYWKKKQIEAYIRLLNSILCSKNLDLIGFWEPCLGRTFYYQDDEPGFLDVERGIMDKKLRILLRK